MNSPTITLNNNTRIPQLGLGVWKASNGQEAYNAIRWALDYGYRHIDTAKVYGNEETVGKAVRDSGIPRDQIWITTKLANQDQGYDSGKQAFETSLRTLNLDYVDLYLIHWPVPEKRQDSWKALEEIYQTGKAKSIGVSNYTIKHLQKMMNYANILPVLNQVEFHPFLYQKELMEFCHDNQIQVEAYSPLAHGEKIQDPAISHIAQKYNKSNAQIMIKWSLQHGLICIPKSTNQERIKQNFDVFDFDLTSEDIATLDGLNENYRSCWDPSDLQ